MEHFSMPIKMLIAHLSMIRAEVSFGLLMIKGH